MMKFLTLCGAVIFAVIIGAFAGWTTTDCLLLGLINVYVVNVSW